MKVGLTITTHRSARIRPDGSELLGNFFKSFKDSNFNYPYTIYVSDNQSEIPFDYPTDLNLDVEYIENQQKKGLTGAWNNSIYRAYQDGCDVIWNFNDDIELNSSMNDFVKQIISHSYKDVMVFGPTSDNGGSPSPNTFREPQPDKGVYELQLTPNTWGNLPNGFSFAFTRNFYKRFSYTETEFFPIDHSLNGGDGKWGGQEGYFGILAGSGMRASIVKDCWLKHYKTRTWMVARDEK